MGSYYYETVKISEGDVVDDDIKNDNSTVSRKYLLRQIFICSGIWSCYFCVGLSFGSPTVIIPQLRQEANSSDAVSTEMASWLSSTFSYSTIVSHIILAVMASLIGRKPSFLFICITALIAYMVLYFSETVTQILISEIIHGPLMSSPITVSIMILTEYVTPRYRGVFLTIKSATFIWGIWVANAIGTFFHWKNIAIVAFICSMYSLLTTLLWPESPYWLANKNRLEDCAKAHRWLKGQSKESEAELELLIQSRKLIQPSEVTSVIFQKKILKMFTSKSFYKPFLLLISVSSLYQFSGKLACGMYSIDIIKRITGKESTAYTGMLILDGITVIGMYVGCGVSKFLNRRSLLLVSSTIGVTFLFCISFYLYLIHLEVISENTIISISLLMGYSLTISVGPMIMCTTVISELIPVKYRSSSVLLLGCYGSLLMGTMLKIFPFVLNKFGARGVFLFFAVIESILIFINYKTLPETKDKTLLEIQANFLDNKSRIEPINTQNSKIKGLK